MFGFLKPKTQPKAGVVRGTVDRFGTSSAPLLDETGFALTLVGSPKVYRSSTWGYPSFAGLTRAGDLVEFEVEDNDRFCGGTFRNLTMLAASSAAAASGIAPTS